MKKHAPENFRVTTGPLRSSIENGMNGLFLVQYGKKKITVLVSDGGGWDHVSVSHAHRCPTWDEMCFVKNLFFEKTETAIQYHPAEANYVNRHKYTLHMWRKQDCEIEMPPIWFV
jgi:hypothetical protein